MAGTVATYELVLLDRVEHVPQKAHICNDTFIEEIAEEEYGDSFVFQMKSQL